MNNVCQEVVLMCALRYAYPRKSYVVATVADEIYNYCEKEPQYAAKFIKELERLHEDSTQTVLSEWQTLKVDLTHLISESNDIEF